MVLVQEQTDRIWNRIESPEQELHICGLLIIIQVAL